MMGSQPSIPPLDVLCVGDSEAYCCGICYSIYEQATLLVPCGHSFCEGCVGDIGSSVCPFCNVAIQKMCPNYALRSAVSAMPVRCPGYFVEDKPQQWIKRPPPASACHEILAQSQLKAHVDECAHAKAGDTAASQLPAPDAQDELMRARAKRRRLQAQQERECSERRAAAPAIDCIVLD